MTFLFLFSLTQSSVYKEKVTYGSDVTILKIAIFSHRTDLKNTDKITRVTDFRNQKHKTVNSYCIVKFLSFSELNVQMIMRLDLGLDDVMLSKLYLQYISTIALDTLN